MLRPTLIYGGGRDRSLSLLVAMARRYGFVLLPYQANGLRQPVHVADVAMAVEILLSEAGGLSATLDLPGAEVLGFKAMVSRSLAAAMADARVLQLPSALMQLVLVWAVRLSLIPEGSAAFLARVGRDQVFDAGPAIARIGWKPRSFNPSAGDFVSKT